MAQDVNHITNEAWLSRIVLTVVLEHYFFIFFIPFDKILFTSLVDHGCVGV